jgi:hypothetical protein
MNEIQSSYLQTTRTATYGFLAAVPLLVAYEALILITNGATTAPVRVGADVWIKQLIASVGATGMFAIGLGLLVVGSIVMVKDRKKGIPLRPAYFGWMIAESLVYAVVVAAIVSRLVQMVFSGMGLAPGLTMALDFTLAPDLIVAATPQADFGMARMIALSIGAGLYEELVFRVVLVGGLFWVLNKFLSRRLLAYGVAAFVGALIFSAVHYIGVYGDPFELPSFTFRFLFGLALNGLFLARGFGVAAWTHALYDILVVTHLLG